jgi:uncharacterized protein YeaO (DUF488 family)
MKRRSSRAGAVVGEVRVKRAYRAARRSDGARILVDRLWPRGMSKDRLRLADWLKDIAPSEELRRWFGHDPARWQEFLERYGKELDGKGDMVAALRARAADGTVTLIYAAKDEAHNNAVALKGYLDAQAAREEGAGSGSARR